MHRRVRHPIARRTVGALLLALSAIAVPHAAAAAPACPEAATVPARIVTDRGAIDIALDRANAPATVENFLQYARDDFYAGTIFHRVIAGFMIQGGGLTPGLERKETRAPIVNESDNGLSNERGTLAMARTRDPDSATAQFFINLVDNARLDGRGGRPGYTVFARVTGGMDVVDAIASAATERRGGRRNVPKETVRIEGVTIAPDGCDAGAAAGDS